MIEPFCSVYTKSYRPFDIKRKTKGTKPCIFYEDLKENFLPTDDSKDTYNPERDDPLIREMYLKRLASTYHVSYCENLTKEVPEIDHFNIDDDQFMVNFINFYTPHEQQVLPPLHTSRIVNGYMRFSNFYTGISTYQDTISRLGYDYFKRNYDQGKSRLYGKKQMEKKWQDMEKECAEKNENENDEEEAKQKNQGSMYSISVKSSKAMENIIEADKLENNNSNSLPK